MKFLTSVFKLVEIIQRHDLLLAVSGIIMRCPSWPSRLSLREESNLLSHSPSLMVMATARIMVWAKKNLNMSGTICRKHTASRKPSQNRKNTLHVKSEHIVDSIISITVPLQE